MPPKNGEASGLFKLGVYAVLAWGAWLVWRGISAAARENVKRLPARTVEEIDDQIRTGADEINVPGTDFTIQPTPPGFQGSVNTDAIRDAGSNIGQAVDNARQTVEDTHERVISRPIRDAQDRVRDTFGGLF